MKKIYKERIMVFKKKLFLGLMLGLVSVISLTLALFFMLSPNSAKKAFAEDWKLVTGETELEESYNQGESITIPKRTLTIEGGSTVDASYSVEFPSGSTTSQSEISLSEVGNYSVYYYAKVNEKIYYMDPVSFLVKAKGLVFADSSLGSSMYYGEYQGQGPKPSTEGLFVRLAKGDTLKVNQIIDVDTLTGSNPLVELFITPDSRGVADMEGIIIKLIDVFDETNFLTFDLHWNSGFASGIAYSWLISGASNQPLAGIESGKGAHYSGDGWGTPLDRVSFIAQQNVDVNGKAAWSGQPADLAPDANIAKILYDHELNQTYLNINFSAKYDDPSVYGENLFNGFASGKVRMEITGKTYFNETANFCLVSINDGRVSLDVENGGLEDTTPPEVTINTSFTTMPLAKVGKAYSIPTASAFDITFGVCDVKQEVLYNYSTDNPVNVSVEDGKFTPNLEGEYTVIYTAKDAYGNVGRAFLKIIAKEELDPIAYDLPTQLSELNGKTDVKLGTLLSLDLPEILGGAGGNVIEIFYKFNNGEEIPVSGSLRLENNGKYTIIYKVSDYVSDEPTVKSVEFTAVANMELVFTESISLPKVFIAELEYVLPELYASDYSSGHKVSKLAKVDVTDKNGTNTYDSGETFVPEVENNGDEITIRYYCEGTDYKTFTANAIIGKVYIDGEFYEGYAEMTNYFYGENIEATFVESTYVNDKGATVNREYSTGCAIVTKETAKESAWTFASVQVADGVNVVIKPLSGQPRLEAMDFVLTDYVDESYVVTLHLVFNGGSVFITCGDETAELKNYAVDTSYEIKYAKGKLSFGGVAVKVASFDDGREFNGFPSSKVYMSLVNKSISGSVIKGGRYLVLSVSGQPISRGRFDTTPPAFALIGSLSGAKTKGMLLTIPAAACADVFNPNSAVYVTVYGANNEIITDNNGLTLDEVPADVEYQISLNNIGTYTVVYEYTELGWNENAGSSTFAVRVYDNKAPEVRFTGEYVASVNRGADIKFRDFAVSDDFTPNDQLTVIRAVETSGGKFIILKEKVFTPVYTGTYKFIVLVRDAAGNTSMASYSVEVK